MSYKQQIPTWPSLEHLNEDERAMTYAELLARQGDFERALAIIEQLPSPEYDTYAEGKAAEFRMAIATRQDDWRLGLGIWEDYCEWLAARDSTFNGIHLAFAEFFGKYAEHLTANGATAEAKRFEQKAKRLNDRTSPLVRMLRRPVGPTAAPE